MRNFEYKGGWRRVSADHPVIVYAEKIEYVRTKSVLKAPGHLPAYEKHQYQTIMGIPYPGQ